jgi:hypothetical protein
LVILPIASTSIDWRIAMRTLILFCSLVLATVAGAEPPVQQGGERKPLSDSELLREHYFRQEQANLAQSEANRRILTELAAVRAELQELRRICR